MKIKWKIIIVVASVLVVMILVSSFLFSKELTNMAERDVITSYSIHYTKLYDYYNKQQKGT